MPSQPNGLIFSCLKKELSREIMIGVLPKITAVFEAVVKAMPVMNKYWYRVYPEIERRMILDRSCLRKRRFFSLKSSQKR